MLPGSGGLTASIFHDEANRTSSARASSLDCFGRGLEQGRSVVFSLLFFFFFFLFFDPQINLRLSSDYEIFRLNDEVTAAEGANVTFYGTPPLKKIIFKYPPLIVSHGQISWASNPMPTKMN